MLSIPPAAWGVAQKVERCELYGRHIHLASVGFAVLYAIQDSFQVFTIIESDQSPANVDFRQPFVRDNLELHNGLMRSATQLGRLEEADIIRPPFMPHEVINIPTRRRGAPGRVLGRNQDIEPASWFDEVLAALESLGGVQKRAPTDSQCPLGLAC